MRRLFAFIAAAIAILIGVGVSFSPVATKVISNIQYQSGHEFVYVMSDKDNPDEEIPDGAVDELAQTMIQRLNASQISDYEVKTDGNDTIRVAISEKNETSYNQIKQLLRFSADFSLCTQTGTCALASDIFKDSVAYLTFLYNVYPVTVIPVDVNSSAYKLVFDEAKRIADEASKEEGADTSGADLILWSNKTEDDTYEKYQEAVNDSTKCQDITEKVIMKFSFGTDGTDLYLPDYDDRLASTTLTIDQNTTPTSSQLSSATATARWLVNVFNSSELDYDVTFLFERGVDMVLPTVESLVVSGFPNTSVAMSRTLIAFIVAFIIACCCAVLFYRLAGVPIVVLSTLTTFVTFALLVSFTTEFTIATLVGLLITAISSFAAGIIYAQKLKEECYKGRSLKKANAEASRRSTLPIIDISVIMVICGLFFYLLGGSYLAPLGAAISIGGVASVIFNTFILKFMMWLSTNASCLHNRYDVFGIELNQVPDVLKEEKQNYFGRFADSNFTKKKSCITVSSILGAFLVAGIIAMSVIGCTNGGVVYNQNGMNVNNSDYYITITNSSSAISDVGSVKSILDKIEVYANNDATSSKSALLYDEVYTYTRDYINSDDIKINYVYYVVNFSKTYNGNELVVYTNGGIAITDSLNNTLEFVISNIDSTASVGSGVKTVYSENNPPQASSVFIASIVALVVSAVYIMLRYRPSRGLSTIILTFAAAAGAVGVYSFVYAPAISATIIASTMVIVFGLILAIILANRERELIKELKVRKLTKEEKLTTMKKAVGSAAQPILALTFATSTILVGFVAAGPTSLVSIFMSILVGVLLLAAAILSIFGPLSYSFNALLSRINFELPKRKRHKRVQRQTSAEPEEAIFIGIND